MGAAIHIYCGCRFCCCLTNSFENGRTRPLSWNLLFPFSVFCVLCTQDLFVLQVSPNTDNSQGHTFAPRPAHSREPPTLNTQCRADSTRFPNHFDSGHKRFMDGGASTVASGGDDSSGNATSSPSGWKEEELLLKIDGEMKARNPNLEAREIQKQLSPPSGWHGTYIVYTDTWYISVGCLALLALFRCT